MMQKKSTNITVQNPQIDFQEIFEKSNDGIVVIQDLQFIYANEGLCNLTGYTQQELIGKNFLDFVDKEVVEQIAIRNKLRLKGETVPTIYETKIIKRDSKLLTVEINASTINYNNEVASVALIRDITERKKTENALAKSEQRLKYALDAMDEGLWDYDIVNDKIYYNDNYFLMAGYDSTKEMQNTKFFKSHVHPLDLDEVEKKTKSIINGYSSVYENEFRFKNANGKYIWIQAKGKIVEWDENGKPSRFVGTHLDITKRKEIEHEIIKKNNLLETLLDTIPIPVFYKDNKGVFTGCNKAYEEYVGVTKEQLIGTTVFEHYPLDLANEYFRADRELLLTQKPQVFTSQVKAYNGDRKDTIIYKNLFYDQDNNPNGIIGVFFDISKINSVKNELEKNRNYLKTILEQIPLILLTFDSEGIVKFIEGEGLRHTELLKHEIVGKSLFDVMEDRKEILELLKRALTGEEIFTSMKSKDKIYEVYFTPLINSGNEGTEFLGLAVDETERITAENEIKQYVVELKKNEKELLNNTKELESLNFSLEESKQKLTDVIASKDKFFSIISHDLKSPFSGLLGLSELIIKEFETISKKDQFEILNSIHSSTKGIFNLIENLLNWSAVQLDKAETNFKNINLYKIVEEAFTLVKLKASEKNLTLENNISSTRTAYADLHMIQTVVRNLVSNAVKYNSISGKIEISSTKTKSKVEIIIKDTGIGLSEDDVQKLFRIDVMNSEIGNSKEKGTGLGLILCKELIEKNNGTIKCNSELGKGSTFIITLPAHK